VDLREPARRKGLALGGEEEEERAKSGKMGALLDRNKARRIKQKGKRSEGETGKN
jgi:hypothetical protein